MLFAIDGITSFSTFPLRLAIYLGFIAAVIGIPYAIWAVYLRLFTNEAVTGWSSLIVAILFLGGVQLICMGILGEYVGRIYEEVKGRPLYIAQETLGLEEEGRSRKCARRVAMDAPSSLLQTTLINADSENRA